MLHFEAQPDMLIELLRRVGGGDREAFRQLHTLCCKRLLPFAKRIVISKDTADDVLQESFIAIWRDAASFDSTRAAPMTWMITIVRNKAIDSLRANLRRESLTDHDRQDGACLSFDPAAGPDEAAELAQRSRQLQLGMAKLAELPRQAIELAFFQDLTHGEVAVEMTVPLGTVKTWIRRGCKRIRSQLEQTQHAAAPRSCRSPAC